MQPYDFGMLLVLIAATVFGFWKGVAWQLASLGSLVASYLVAMRFSETLAPYLSVQTPWNKFLAMLVLYSATSLVIWFAFRFVSETIDRVKLREFDRQAGGLFGAAKGVLWCVVITFFAVTLSDGAREKILKSRSGYYIAMLIHRAKPIMPDEAQKLLGPYLDQLDRELDPRNPGPEPTNADKFGRSAIR
jgi:membrane protein required for colicin V production